VDRRITKCAPTTKRTPPPPNTADNKEHALPRQKTNSRMPHLRKTRAGPRCKSHNDKSASPSAASEHTNTPRFPFADRGSAQALHKRLVFSDARAHRSPEPLNKTKIPNPSTAQMEWFHVERAKIQATPQKEIHNICTHLNIHQPPPP
jgi:hypothetical protein